MNQRDKLFESESANTWLPHRDIYCENMIKHCERLTHQRQLYFIPDELGETTVLGQHFYTATFTALFSFSDVIVHFVQHRCFFQTAMQYGFFFVRAYFEFCAVFFFLCSWDVLWMLLSPKTCQPWIQPACPPQPPEALTRRLIVSL